MTFLPFKLADCSDERTLRLNLQMATEILAVETLTACIETAKINAVRDNVDLVRGENLLCEKGALDCA